MIVHPIPPLYNSESKILILGSFPSVKSRETEFFYGHRQNRFWKVTSAVFEEELPDTIEEKRAFLLKSGIALWDVIKSCEITGSSDSSIKNVAVNDIMPIIKDTGISKIFVNGKKAYALYKKYILPQTGIEAVCLPSTSPANAGYSLDKLIEEWKCIRD